MVGLDTPVYLPSPYTFKYILVPAPAAAGTVAAASASGSQLVTHFPSTSEQQQQQQQQPILQLVPAPAGLQRPGARPPSAATHADLHDAALRRLFVTPLLPPPDAHQLAVRLGVRPPGSGDGANSPFARAARLRGCFVSWDRAADGSGSGVTVAQAWLLAYAVFSIWPGEEAFRLGLVGRGGDSAGDDRERTRAAQAITAAGLGFWFPSRTAVDGQPVAAPNGSGAAADPDILDLVIPRATFWQGAGSPFGARPVWLPPLPRAANPVTPTVDVPAFPLSYTLTSRAGSRPVHTRHPVRPAKPPRGAEVYSRYIPHLSEFLSFVHLDWTNAEHVGLFHAWQNDPRVAAGWQQTGTEEEHREYLRQIDEDPHQMALLVAFEGVFFAYCEIYWAKEDHMGTHLPSSGPAPDFDRGRHSLVGNAAFRGPRRAAAWWASLVHYLFLDEPRTMRVVGEPRAPDRGGSAAVAGYDVLTGFAVDGWGELPHKRSSMVGVSRGRFFEVVGFGYEGEGEGKGERASRL